MNFSHPSPASASLNSAKEFVLSCFVGRYIRVAVLPSSTDISCLFRTKVHPAVETILFNEIFRVAVSQVTLLQKTLRVDVCAVSRSRREECLVCGFISGAFLACICL